MRDALVAGLTLNYLNDRCDRVRMANIAQTVNVLQSLIFTDEEKMMLTPTYHVYDMYKVHHDAEMLPVDVDGPDYSFGDQRLPAVSISASRSEAGLIHLSTVNIDPERKLELAFSLVGVEVNSVSATLLSAKDINSHNTFEHPEEVVIREFSDVKIKGEQILLNLPAHSIVMLEIR
jgi:alpha-N-arabinofuranosidase